MDLDNAHYRLEILYGATNQLVVAKHEEAIAAAEPKLDGTFAEREVEHPDLEQAVATVESKQVAAFYESEQAVAAPESEQVYAISVLGQDVAISDHGQVVVAPEPKQFDAISASEQVAAISVPEQAEAVAEPGPILAKDDMWDSFEEIMENARRGVQIGKTTYQYEACMNNKRQGMLKNVEAMENIMCLRNAMVDTH